VNVWKMAIVAAGSALLLAACGSSGGGNGSGTSCAPTGGSSSGSGTTVVKVVSDPNTVGKFDPTTVTVTAASSNSETWGAFVFGNPN